jgi:hypothetical protein
MIANADAPPRAAAYTVRNGRKSGRFGTGLAHGVAKWRVAQVISRLARQIAVRHVEIFF